MKAWDALTIRTRIILAATVVFAVALACFALVIYHGSRRAEFAKLEARLESHADKFQTEIEEQLRDGVFPNLPDFNSIRTEGLSRVLHQLYDSENRVILPDSVLAQADLPLFQSRSVDGPAVRRINIKGKRFLGYKVPVEVENHGRFELLLAAPLDEVDDNLARLRWLFFLSIPATLLVAGLAISVITSRALKPLTTMTQTARHISATNLSQRLELPPADDEVRVFAETLNKMIERIEIAFLSQKQFVSDASHEIRTPLTVLTSELENLRSSVNRSEAQASVDALLLEIDRLSHLVEGLLMLTRIDAPRVSEHPKQFRLDEVLIEAVQSCRWLADKKHVTLTPFVQEAAELQGDGELIRRALLNVLDNAVKYSPSHSEVTINLQVRDNQAVTVIVQDRGPGISEEDQGRIFERFFRGQNARAETEGSGLGLAIARKAVELHGGLISVQSEVGKGTTVTISLPITPLT